MTSIEETHARGVTGCERALPDTSHEERRPVGQALLDNTRAQSALMGFTPEVLALRELVNELLRLPVINQRLARQISGLDVAYPSAPVPAPVAGALPGWTGRRLPDAMLKLADGSQRSHSSALHAGQWLWLHSGRDAPPSSGWEPVPGWRPRLKVLTLAASAEEGPLRGVDGLLVRPDGHVGWAWATSPSIEE